MNLKSIKHNLKTEKTLITIIGPTASGKTALGIYIAKHFNTEIISADSRQFYKELNVGVARPSDQELGEVRHHFIADRSITAEYSAGKFETEALQKLNKLFEQHEKIVCVGGSTLYVQALLEGLDELPGDMSIRSQLKKRLDEEGLQTLTQELLTRDPIYHAQVDLRNPHRILRALEVCLITGESYSALRKKNSAERTFGIIKIGLNPPREWLYERINKRVDKMMEQGLLNEVKNLDPLRHVNALQTVGYSELFDYLDGKLTLEQAIEKIKQHSRNYAKRQLTWWRRDPDIHWLDSSRSDFQEEALQLIKMHTKA